MLKIKIGNTYVSATGVEIPVVLRSSIFSEGKGSYIFNFQVYATPELKKELDYFHRPGRSGASYITRSLEVSFGLLKYTGTAKITFASDEFYEVSCPVENGDLASLLKTKELTEIDLGGIRGTESIKLLVEASSTQDQVVYGTTSDEYITKWILFDNKIIDVYDNLNGGTIFTSSMNEMLTFVFDLKYAYIRGETVMFRVMKNGEFEQSCVINKGFTTQLAAFDIYVEVDDQISWQLYCLGDPVINFTLNIGSRMRIYDSWKEMIDNSLNLYPDGDYVLCPIENPSFFDNLDDDAFLIDHLSIKEIYSNYFPVLNYYLNNRFPVAMSGYINGEFMTAFNMLCPFPYLAYVIKQIFSFLNVTIENNVFEEIDLKQLIVFNAFTENNYLTEDIIQPRDGFDLIDHIPDVTISDYLENLFSLLGIVFTYNSSSRVIKLKNLADIANDFSYTQFPGIITESPKLTASPLNGYVLTQKTSNDEYITNYFKSIDDLAYKGSVDTYLSLPWHNNKINDCYYVTLEKSYYFWNYDPENPSITWLFFSKDWPFVKKEVNSDIDDNSFEISTDIFPIMLNGFPYEDHQLCAPNPRSWLIPKTFQQGNFDGIPSYFKTDFSQSLLFYHGLRYDSNSQLYPLASPDIYDYAGNPITFESAGSTPGYTHSLSLRWDGPNGLYEKRYKAWLDILMKSRGSFTFTAYIDPADLATIDLLKWYSAPGFKFMIKEIRFTLTEKNISVAELDVLVR